MSNTHDIFLSYSRDDQATARHFAEGFERAGFSVWWDVTLNAGEDYDQVTEQALRAAKAVVVLWSAKSVASRWVRTEATIALQCKTLVPVTIEACQRPIMFELTQTADLCHWSGDSSDAVWQTFLSDVQRFVQRGQHQGSEAQTLASTSPPTARRTAPAQKNSAATRSSIQFAWGVSALFALVAAVLAWPALQYLREEAPAETRLDIVTPASAFPYEFALSPDGSQLVFVANGEADEPQLWIRPLAVTTAQPLAGTEGARTPFWSADGRAIGFLADTELKRFDMDSGATRTLTAVSTQRGGTWAADNTLLFTPNQQSPLMRMSANGGEASAITAFAPQQASHRFPHFLPDGQHFLFYALGSANDALDSADAAGIYLGHLDGRAPVKLTPADSAGVYHPDGWLLWVKTGTLTAQHLDLAQAALTGEPLTIAQGVADNQVGLGAVSVATTGLIAHRSVGSANQRNLRWVDRAGTVLGTLADSDDTRTQPRLSPDGRRVAVKREGEGGGNIWMLDDARSSRFTFATSADSYPVWSPDGSRIVFSSARPETGTGIYQKSSSGAAAETLLLGSDQGMTPTSWSADGRFLLYGSTNDLYAVPMTGEPVPFVVLQTPFDERWGAFSPDGRWVAYQSNESGRNEIYVRAFTVPANNAASAITVEGQWQISAAGGIHPLWSPDGKELFYLDPAGNLMAAPLTATVDTVEAGVPTLLFPTRMIGGGVDTGVGPGRQYDVAPDGRFLINSVGDGTDDRITLIQNWNPER